VIPAHPNLHVLLLGEGVPEHVSPLAREFGIADRCHFLGHQSNVAEWVSIMHLTVIAAWEREGLSGVLRESMAMEIPVVSTDCSGNGEIVRDHETGLLVPMRDPEALSKALDWALGHPEAMKTMAREGRRWVQDHCSPATQAIQLEEIYRKIQRAKR
jgi:glycosyltransferase involved in cell wall biosynthesis